jgi:DNA-binding transcriptional LysR family regulator
VSGRKTHSKKERERKELHARKDIHLRQIDSFLAAASADSFSEAADELDRAGIKLDRTAVRRDVASLEDFLGLKLFRRSGNSVTLNEAGRAFQAQAPEILQRIYDVRHDLQPLNPVGITTVHTGFARTPTLEFRQRAAEVFDTTYAPRRVRLHDLAADQCKAGINIGILHAGLVPEPLELPDGIAFEPLVDYEVCCVVGSKHDLFGDGSVNVKDLRRERFLAYSKKSFPQYHAYLRKLLGYTPNIVSDEYHDDEELLSDVHRNHGVALLLSTVAALPQYNLCCLKLLPARPRVSVGFLFKEPCLAEVGLLRQSAKQVLNKLAGADGRTPCGGHVLKTAKPPIALTR